MQWFRSPKPQWNALLPEIWRTILTFLEDLTAVKLASKSFYATDGRICLPRTVTPRIFSRLMSHLASKVLPYLEVIYCSGSLINESTVALMRTLPKLSLAFVCDGLSDARAQCLLQGPTLTALMARDGSLNGSGLCGFEKTAVQEVQFEACTSRSPVSLPAPLFKHSRFWGWQALSKGNTHLTSLCIELVPFTRATSAYLSVFTALRELSVRRISTNCPGADVLHLENFHNLRELEFVENPAFAATLRKLPLLTQLTGKLAIAQFEMSDDILAQVPSTLTTLAMQDTSVTDKGLESLSRLHDLRHLVLGGRLFTSKGVKALTALTQLTGLHLQALLKFNSLANLSSITTLQSLSLEPSDHLLDSDIPAIAKLTSLTDLTIAPCPRLTDTSLFALADLPHLTRLKVYEIPIAIGTFACLRNLQLVSLNGESWLSIDELRAREVELVYLEAQSTLFSPLSMFPSVFL